METQQITLERLEARALWRKYREHQHYSKPIDREVMLTYQRIAQGKLVIKALESIVTAGLGEDGLPKLAIVRADAEHCFFEYQSRGAARFAMVNWVREASRRTYIDLPPGSFAPPPGVKWRAQTIVPLIPLHLRPKRGLENYHVLFEAEWRPAPPVDPMLLRRIGQTDLWVVMAAWDLTPIEQAVLAARV